MSAPRIDATLAAAIGEADSGTIRAEMKALQAAEGDMARKLNATRRTIEAMKIELRRRDERV